MSVAAPSIEEELAAFERGTLDPALFPHREHVRFAYEMLARHSFGEAVTRFSRGLRLLAGNAGRPQLYHETITVAFLAVIGERRAKGDAASWCEFIAKNQDLLEKNALGRWFHPRSCSRIWRERRFVFPPNGGRP